MVPASASVKTRTAAKKIDIAELCTSIAARHTSNPVKPSLVKTLNILVVLSLITYLYSPCLFVDSSLLLKVRLADAKRPQF